MTRTETGNCARLLQAYAGGADIMETTDGKNWTQIAVAALSGIVLIWESL